MIYHPAIGDLRAQAPRLGVIVGLIVASLTIVTFGPARPRMPSERWTHLSGQQVANADMSYRVGLAVEAWQQVLPGSLAERGPEMIEEAIAAYERQALGAKPNAAAVHRLGIVYGHRGYRAQAEQYLTTAVGLDEENSEYYYALAEVYAVEDPGDGLLTQLEVLAEHPSWLTEIALQDGYARAGLEQRAEAIAASQTEMSLRFGAGCAALSIAVILLVLVGLGVITVSLIRRGMTLPRPRAPLPFLVPWTVIDALEIVAILIFAMVFVGEIAEIVWANVFEETSGPLGRPILLLGQYVLVAVACLTLILHRVNRRSQRPLISLGLRMRNGWRMAVTGAGGYGTFLAALMLAALALRGLVGDAVPLGQAGEPLMGSVDTAGEILIYFLLACVLAPIFEEIVFRGYVYAGLRRVASPRWAMLLGGLIFASVHMNPAAMVIITLIGILLCYLYERTRSLLPGMVAHSLHNALVLWVVVLQAT